MHTPLDKVMTLEQAAEWRRGLRTGGQRLVLTNGCFDLLHRGHVQYLNDARALGDALLVAVNTDVSISALKGPGRPVIAEADRVYLLASLEAVDAVVPFGSPASTNVCPLLSAIRPDLYVKGGGYTVDTINQEERRLLDSLGVRIALLPLVPGISTTELLRRIRQAENA